MINALDNWVMHITGEYAQKSLTINRFIIDILPLVSVKLLPLVSSLWLLWFSKTLGPRSRLAVVQGFIGMIMAGTFARVLQNLLSERQRPLHSGDPNFVLPLGSNTSILEHWSSFPSDHAVIAFALSTAIWRTSKALGAACYAWSTFVVCLPRVYAGWHYASDVVGGALIGVVIVLALERILPLEARIMPLIATVEKRYTGLFYALFFFFSFQLAIMFDDVRHVLYWLYKQLWAVGLSQ